MVKLKHIETNEEVIMDEDNNIFYNNSYENEPIGDGNPYYCCVDCGIPDPQINGNILNHSQYCEHREVILENLGYEFIEDLD